MITFKTDRKFTVVLSAWRSHNSGMTNLLLTERLFDNIENRLHLHAIRAIGCYQRDAEQSFIIHTNSSNDVNELKRLAFDVYDQDAVLVVYNRKHAVKLHFQNATTEQVGNRMVHSTKPVQGHDSYTILNGCDYWSVAG